MTEARREGLPAGQALVGRDRWPVVGERVPRAGAQCWRVSIGGAAACEHSLTLAELRQLGWEERVVDIHCVTRWSRPGVRFGGVPMAALVDLAAPSAAARFVSFIARSERDHSTSLPLADARDALVALEADGEPLASEHGGPVRVVVGDRYFYKSLKWLERIELLAEDRLGYWEGTAGYHNHGDPWREQRFVASNLDRREVARLLASRDLRGRDLRGLEGAGLDLEGLRAEGASLRNADLRRARLGGANLGEANLSGARLQGADLRGASLVGADLEGAILAGADLRGADLRLTSLFGATLFEDAVGAVVDGGTRLDQPAIDSLLPEQQAWLRTALAD